MKSLAILMFLCGAVLISCQTNAKNLTAVSSIEPIFSPTPLPTPCGLPIPKSFDIHSKVGIVDGDKDNICFRTKNGDLAENTTVSIITSFYDPSLKVLNAKIEKKLSSSCSRRASESTDKNPGENFYYLLTLTDKEVDEYQEVFGFGVIAPTKPIQIQNNFVSTDLNEDGKSEYFRLCSGNEGTLFAIWTGKPLKGKQIWHSFYYVDYDTVLTCKKEDLKKTED
ncbi:MAG TPA: hypothetical protein PKE69_06555 [Pyrinomonadaceae bacterium]|nr:hypothetical protein [Pyrinomonadaceae bacterium]